MDINIKYLENLNYSWTADVLLNNNQKIKIWYTALAMTKESIKSIIAVSSDYPKHFIKYN